MRKVSVTLLALLALLAGGSTVTQAQRGLTLITPKPVERVTTCLDTREVARARRNRIRPLEVPDGQALSFIQEPAVLSPDYAGTIVLREFMIAGDVPTVQFQFFDGAVEVWPRERMDTLAGRAVSVFQPSWPASALGRALALNRWGWDQPEIVWGSVIGGAAGADKQIWLRLGPGNIPDVAVTRLTDDVQFASHVVNIVSPGFGDQVVLQGDETEEIRAVTRKFYEHFEDTYDVLSLVPQRALLRDFTAYHVNVSNDISGIGDVSGVGRVTYNDAELYGSAGRLRGYELFPLAYASNDTLVHETAHQWGHYIDWTTIAGLARAGHQPGAHEPLWATEATVFGAVLEGNRRIVGGAGWTVERTPAPIRVSPLTLYAMGLRGADQVGDTVLFNEQGQFSATATVAPEPGTPVVGAVQAVPMATLVGALGARTGPAVTEWHRATIIVSSTPLSQREMNFWNFLAQRQEDPNRSGMLDFEGYASFDASTGNASDLKTSIRPRAAAAIVQPLEVDYPAFGTTDLRGVTLDAPLSTRVTPGSTVRLAGRVTVADLERFDRVAFRFTRVDGGPAPELGLANIGGGGTFAVEFPFDASLAGQRFQLEMFLFERGADNASSIFQVSTFLVN